MSSVIDESSVTFNRFNPKEKLKKRRILIRPYTYLTDSIGKDSLKMSILLSLQILMLLITRSYQAVFVILASVSASIIANFINYYLQSSFEIEDHFSFSISFVQGVIVGMLLPQNYPPVTVFFATLFTMLIVKYMFGGYAHAWVNPSVCAVAVMWIIGSSLFPDYLVNYDLLSMRNPSQIMIEGGVFPVYKFDSVITDFLNNTIFGVLKFSLPEGYVSLFWDTGSVIPAFRFNLLTLLSSIVIFNDDIVKYFISIAFLLVYMILVRYISPLFFGAMDIKGDILLALLTGGTLFASTFVIGWYGTNPMTIPGKLIYGSLAGISCFFISGCGTSPCGMVFTVVTVNIISVVIQQIETQYDRKRLEKVIAKREALENVN